MRIIKITMFSLLITFIILPVFAQTKLGRVKVIVNQIVESDGGNLKIGLYNAEGFPVLGKELAGVDIEIKESSISYIFTKVPIGSYAIATFQDINLDSVLNTNFLGFPVEPYGFSLNKYGLFSPPSFNDVSFTVKENEEITLTINLE